MANLLPSDLVADENYENFDDWDTQSINTTGSITSSTRDFESSFGRKYNIRRADRNPFPRGDELARANEELFHDILLVLLDNNLHTADIGTPKHILDLGCGLGLWTENVAERYPDSQVLGIDQVLNDSVLPNLTYEVMDVTEEWIFNSPDEKFDFMHIRGLFASIADWPELYKQCFHSLESGGYIEQTEVEIQPLCDDRSGVSTSHIQQAADTAAKLSEAWGQEFNITRDMKRMIVEAGFEDVQEFRYKLPLGPWATDVKAREIGNRFEYYYKTGLQGWMMKPCTQALGWTPEQVNDMCDGAFAEIDERRMHYYFTLVIVVGKRP